MAHEIGGKQVWFVADESVSAHFCTTLLRIKFKSYVVANVSAVSMGMSRHYKLLYVMKTILRSNIASVLSGFGLIHQLVVPSNASSSGHHS